jgi:DNA uptake protein ComE-like DNA-binding protein
MRSFGIIRVLVAGLLGVLLTTAMGCSPNETDEQRRQREEKTRDEVAKATERAKPALEKAGKELGEAAKAAGEMAHAAADGVKEGWDRANQNPLDLNSASENDLLVLPGITRRDAHKIIAGRPYQDKHELVSRHILPQAAYDKIRDQVTIK